MEKNRMKVLVFELGQEPHVEIINKDEGAYRELVGGDITAKPLDDNTVIVYNDIKSEENAMPNRLAQFLVLAISAGSLSRVSEIISAYSVKAMFFSVCSFLSSEISRLFIFSLIASAIFANFSTLALLSHRQISSCAS